MMKHLNVKRVIFAGHSLGGTAAFCLAGKYTNSRAVCFNPGAAPTNPVTSGPGPGRAHVYHIVGDIISTHIGSNAALVRRVKIQGIGFGSIEAHSSTNIFTDRPWTLVGPTEEDLLYQKWIRQNVLINSGLFYSRYILLVKKNGAREPIPDSDRSKVKENPSLWQHLKDANPQWAAIASLFG